MVKEPIQILISFLLGVRSLTFLWDFLKELWESLRGTSEGFFPVLMIVNTFIFNPLYSREFYSVLIRNIKRPVFQLERMMKGNEASIFDGNIYLNWYMINMATEKEGDDWEEEYIATGRINKEWMNGNGMVKNLKGSGYITKKIAFI